MSSQGILHAKIIQTIFEFFLNTITTPVFDFVDQSSGFIERAVRSFSIPRIDDIQTIVHQSFNECEKLQLLYKESEMVGKTEDSSIQPKSFFELISTTDIGYKKALELASSQNKGLIFFFPCTLSLSSARHCSRYTENIFLFLHENVV